MQAAANKLRRAGLAATDAAALAALATPSIRITPMRTATRLPMGASRFGGSPDVPAGFLWPTRIGRPLTFLAQLDLATLRVPDLPASGWLLFFYDVVEQPWGFDPRDDGAAQVIHIDPPQEFLTRCPHPDVGRAGGPFPLCALTFTRTLDLPDADDCLVDDANLTLPDQLLDAYHAVADELAGGGTDGVYHHLLGHPQLVQGDMRRECQLVNHALDTGLAPAPYDSPRARPLLRTAGTTWRLLLQIDSDETGPGWTWGDAGRIYFWIRHDDLVARTFDRAWLVLQCY